MLTSTSSLYCNTVTQGHLVRKDLHETLKYVDEFSELKKMMKFKMNTHTYISLSLLVNLPMHVDFPKRMCMHQSPSLSLSPRLSLYTFAKQFGSRSEFRKECYVNLKICTCDAQSVIQCEGNKKNIHNTSLWIDQGSYCLSF